MGGIKKEINLRFFKFFRINISFERKYYITSLSFTVTLVRRKYREKACGLQESATVRGVNVAVD